MDALLFITIISSHDHKIPALPGTSVCPSFPGFTYKEIFYPFCHVNISECSSLQLNLYFYFLRWFYLFVIVIFVSFFPHLISLKKITQALNSNFIFFSRNAKGYIVQGHTKIT